MMPSTTMFNESGYSGVGYGLGVAVTVNLRHAALPGTVGEYSWGGAAGTYFFCDPKEDLAVVFMTQVLASPERIRLQARSADPGLWRDDGKLRLMLEQFDSRAGAGRSRPRPGRGRKPRWSSGAVLFLRNLAFRLANSEMEFLDGRLTDGKAKNISLDPATHKLQGTSATGEKALRLAAMIERFGAGATRFVTDLLPNYAGVERARTSYRPVEVEGRAYSVIKDDRLLHVDAFPSRPMQQGRRILRFFANVAPPRPHGGGSRRWHVGEPFEDFAGKFAPRLRPHLPGQSWLFDKLGVTRGKRSAYDEMMLSLHDAAKRDAAYQKTFAAHRRGISARLLLAGLYRHGAACGAGGRIRPGADLPFRCRQDGRAGARADPRAGTVDRESRWPKPPR